jgi:probable phosphoglycerate mutase
MHESMTELILIRHGETDWNLQHRFQGQVDVPLNPRGLAQAQRLVQRLQQERLDAFACSDLTRARQTAAPAAAAWQMQPESVAGLREQGFGILEGLSAPEIVARYPAEWEQWRRYDADYAPPRGESLRSFHLRVIAAVRALAQRNPGRRLAVVTHGGALDMVWRAATGQSLHGARSCAIPNAGLNRVKVHEDHIEILDWADDAHVADLGSVSPRVLGRDEEPAIPRQPLQAGAQ